MTKDEALNIAIDYMNERLEEHDAKFQRHPVAEAERNNILADIGAVKEALAQPEQEPVAWYRDEDGIRIYYETKCWDDATPLYTAPQPWEKFCDSYCVWTDHHPNCKLAQRTWVGLRDDEIYSVLENLQVMHHRPPTTDSRVIFAQAIEAKLKEKNT